MFLYVASDKHVARVAILEKPQESIAVPKFRFFDGVLCHDGTIHGRLRREII